MYADERGDTVAAAAFTVGSGGGSQADEQQADHKYLVILTENMWRAHSMCTPEITWCKPVYSIALHILRVHPIYNGVNPIENSVNQCTPLHT